MENHNEIDLVSVEIFKNRCMFQTRLTVIVKAPTLKIADYLPLRTCCSCRDSLVEKWSCRTVKLTSGRRDGCPGHKSPSSHWFGSGMLNHIISSFHWKDFGPWSTNLFPVRLLPQHQLPLLSLFRQPFTHNSKCIRCKLSTTLKFSM